jgi:hypothetical protein
MGALIGKLVSDLLTLILFSHSARKLMGLSLREYLPWGQIAGITLVSAIVSAGSRVLWNPIVDKPFWLLAALVTVLPKLAGPPHAKTAPRYQPALAGI